MTTTITNQSKVHEPQELSLSEMANSPEFLADLVQQARAAHLAQPGADADAEWNLTRVIREYLPIRQSISREYGVVSQGAGITVVFGRSVITSYEAKDVNRLFDLLSLLQNAGIRTLTLRKEITGISFLEGEGEFTRRTLEVVLNDPTRVSVTSVKRDSAEPKVVLEDGFNKALKFFLSATLDDVLSLTSDEA